MKSWLIGKDPDAGRDWGQEEKGTTQDEMAGWHHWLDGRESEWTPGVGDGQGGLVCCDSWGRKESDTTERLNWTDWRDLSILRWCVCVSCFGTPWTVACQAPLAWTSPGKDTGMGCHCLLQVILLTQGSNSGLQHCWQILYQLRHLGSLLKWYISLNSKVSSLSDTFSLWSISLTYTRCAC